jgi:hypothetical protein
MRPLWRGSFACLRPRFCCPALCDSGHLALEFAVIRFGLDFSHHELPSINIDRQQQLLPTKVTVHLGFFYFMCNHRIV